MSDYDVSVFFMFFSKKCYNLIFFVYLQWFKQLNLYLLKLTKRYACLVNENVGNFHLKLQE